MNVRNFNKEMENTISSFENRVPTLLLHSCCAPCSSACLYALVPYFKVTVLYYNPNITDVSEYEKRLEEQRRFIEKLNTGRYVGEGFDTSLPYHDISLIDGRYEPKEFFDAVKGYESCPEGGDRCFICYELRLREAARVADAKGFDYFATTLTLSPLKNAAKLNEIGERLSGEFEATYLVSDFKKKDGYKRSIQLSKEYDLYRQDFCGCVFSRR